VKVDVSANHITILENISYANDFWPVKRNPTLFDTVCEFSHVESVCDFAWAYDDVTKAKLRVNYAIIKFLDAYY
jgi:hypothetical protein